MMSKAANEHWKITPLQGVGPLKFGMSRADVAKLEGSLGEIYRAFEETTPEGVTVTKEARDLGSPVCVFQADRLIEINIDINSSFSITFNDLDVFESDSDTILKSLEQQNNGALAGLGLVLFDKLSINTSGFYIFSKTGSAGQFWEEVGDESIHRTMSIAVQDNFKPYLDHYTPIDFASSK